MRFFYFILNIILQYPFRIFFSRVKLINPVKKFRARTIFVCNHPASFLDPLVISVLQRPIVFFMTRSDVFKPFLKPLLWSVHMLPIYRELDGEDTKSKNEEVFKKCNKILSGGRNLMIFGEGFTDDVFIRRLKPIKKGAARIGFGALESINWTKKIYLQAVGINYADPNHLGGEVLIANSEKICLNEYKELYSENPSKAIYDVTKKIEKLLQEQLTHVENKDWVFFHEHVSRLKRFGLHPKDSDFSIPLQKRWKNSRNFAHWINSLDLENQMELISLKKELETYFGLLKKMKLEEFYMKELSEKQKLKTTNDFLYLLLIFPFIPLGLIHFYLPYIFVKRFTEKTFKRKVFWSSVKLMLGFLVMSIFNIVLVVVLNKLFINNGLISLAYFLVLPLVGIITYYWFEKLKLFKTKNKLNKLNLSSVIEKRKNLISKIDLLCPKI
jgi:1-acyl-sn-glycerol-3-phosphate acyltransferase